MADGYILANGTAVLPDRLIEKATIAARGGKIVAVGEESPAEIAAARPECRGLPVVDCAGAYVLPRLVEMHIHGAFGIGFESVAGAGDLLFVARELRARGVGTFVPTILWDEGAVSRLAAAIEESGLPESALPGIYIEGPFVNPEKRGGIGLDRIQAPDPELCRRILRAARGKLKIMALAPELPGVEALYPILAEAGVRISLGHSAASAGVATPKAPFSMTHLFNAMSGLDHRRGGLANLALAGRSTWAELNADGVHVNETCMAVVSRCIPPEKLILTSDAVVAAGLPHGEYSYFGSPVRSGPDGVRYVGSDTLMGSNRLGMEIVASYRRASGATLQAAVASMSRTPSEVLGFGEATGARIASGAAADLFIWDRDLTSCRRPEALLDDAPRDSTPRAARNGAQGTTK
jgi:N-acetylglucosamine-6-phosphate deacetylase